MTKSWRVALQLGRPSQRCGKLQWMLGSLVKFVAFYIFWFACIALCLWLASLAVTFIHYNWLFVFTAAAVVAFVTWADASS
jgi:hypothetical protein